MSWRDDETLTEEDVDDYEWAESRDLDARIDQMREERYFNELHDR